MKVPKPLDQLLAEINAAIQHIPPPTLFLNNQVVQDKELSFCEEDTVQYVAIEEWSGIKKDHLPLEVSLSDQQIQDLLRSLKQLLAAYHCPVVFQKNLPERVQYRVIRERFNQKTPTQKDAYFSFSLCDRQIPSEYCTMGEAYCHCALLQHFFNKYSFSEETDLEETEEFRVYILKKRYGMNWRKHLGLNGKSSEGC